MTEILDGKCPSAGRSPERLDEKETKALIGEADMDGPFLDYDKKGIQIENAGKEMLGPSLVWKLKVTLKNGRTEYYYVESTGYMVLAREEAAETDQQTPSRQFYRNFQRVQGIPFPFAIISESGDSGESIRLEFESIEVNVPEDDSRFTPQSANK